MLVTLLGSLTVLTLEKFANADSPILVTPLGTVTVPPEPLYLTKTLLLITKSESRASATIGIAENKIITAKKATRDLFNILPLTFLILQMKLCILL